MNKQELEKIEKIKKECREFFELSENDHIPDPPIKIAFTRQEMNDFWNRETPDWVRAIAGSKGIIIYDESVIEKLTPHKKGDFWNTMKHEMTHWYCNHIVDDWRGNPVWFHEGLANIVCTKNMPSPIPIEGKVVDIYYSYCDRPCYRWGFAMVKYLVNEFGKSEVVKFIKKFHNGIERADFDAKFIESFGITPEELEAKVRARVLDKLEQ